MLIRDLMHQGVISCPPETHLGEAAALLTAHRIHALVVAEPGEPPLGVLSDTDLLAGEWLSADDTSFRTMRSMTAGDLMFDAGRDNRRGRGHRRGGCPHAR